MLAHDEDVEDAEANSNNTNNDVHKRILLASSLAEDHSHSEQGEDGTTHVGEHETEVLSDGLLILSKTDLEVDKQSREDTRK